MSGGGDSARSEPSTPSPGVKVGPVEPALAAGHVLLERNNPSRGQPVQRSERQANVLGGLSARHPGVAVLEVRSQSLDKPSGEGWVCANGIDDDAGDLGASRSEVGCLASRGPHSIADCGRPSAADAGGTSTCRPAHFPRRR
jgi:hypothetical protein